MITRLVIYLSIDFICFAIYKLLDSLSIYLLIFSINRNANATNFKIYKNLQQGSFSQPTIKGGKGGGSNLVAQFVVAHKDRLVSVGIFNLKKVVFLFILSDLIFIIKFW
jgi:hypothetical protein